VPLRGSQGLYFEVETRQGNAQLTAQQLGRLGFRLHLAPRLSLTTGYVLAANEYGSGDNKRAPEHRFYQEIALADASGHVRASHRLRAEERWLRPAPEMAFRFAPRLRHQLRLVVPLRAGGCRWAAYFWWPPMKYLRAWAPRKAAASWKKTAPAPAWATA